MASFTARDEFIVYFRFCANSLVPELLVHQRPDIRAAESLLHEASANVGVATANLYPQIVLTGSGGGLGTRFNSGGDIWNVGAGLTAPIFNGGSLQAQKRAAVDAYDEAAAAYRSTVIDSFRQVADALNSIERDADTLGEDERAAAVEIAPAGADRCGGDGHAASLR